MKNPHVFGALGAILVACSLATGGSVAFAQGGNIETKVADYVPEGEIVEEKKKQGIDGTLGASTTLNLTDNSNVVGQVDGFSFLFGVGVIGGLDYLHGKHQLLNTLSLNQSWAKTPVLDEFVKANDVIDLESVYNYFLFDKFGAFGRLNLRSAILKTEDIRAEPVTYVITDPDGAMRTVENAERLELASPFSPLTLNQSFGAFTEPYDSTPFGVSVRLGLGARETLADGVLVLTDDGGTPTVEVTELSNVYQAGLELFAGVDGSISSKRIVYDVGASVLFPFLNNDDQNRDVGELTKFGLAAAVGLNVVDWMTVQYQAQLLRDPQLLDEIQLQNTLLFTFQYTLIEREGEAAAPGIDDEIANYKKQIKAAEQRAKVAEEELAKFKQELEEQMNKAHNKNADSATGETETTPAEGTEKPAEKPIEGEKPADNP